MKIPFRVISLFSQGLFIIQLSLLFKNFYFGNSTKSYTYYNYIYRLFYAEIILIQEFMIENF